QHHFSPPLRKIYPKSRLAIHLPLSLRLELGVFSPNFDKTQHTRPFFKTIICKTDSLNCTIMKKEGNVK
ncbi:hypothetical protein, partial [Exiguobacterium undae]